MLLRKHEKIFRGLCQIFLPVRSNNDGKNIAAKLAEAPPSPSRVSAKASTAETVTFLEQNSTTVPNFAYRLILSCGNLVGVATPSPPLRLAPLEKIHPRKEVHSHEKIQHAPPPPGNQDTLDRGRIRRVFRACHPLQNEPSRVYPASPH